AHTSRRRSSVSIHLITHARTPETASLPMRGSKRLRSTLTTSRALYHSLPLNYHTTTAVLPERETRRRVAIQESKNYSCQKN
ncbi:MAG: hypothetical protein LC747_02720, partial [Acidobacteria bacterium]|nr:hypothetical protein [Acidobacteriota bacterium]